MSLKLQVDISAAREAVAHNRLSLFLSFSLLFLSSFSCVSTLNADDAAASAVLWVVVEVVNEHIIGVVWIWIHICRGGLKDVRGQEQEGLPPRLRHRWDQLSNSNTSQWLQTTQVETLYLHISRWPWSLTQKQRWWWWWALPSARSSKSSSPSSDATE